MGVRDSSNRINSTPTIDVSEINLNCLSDFWHFFFFILMTIVATTKKSANTEEYAIKYFFNTFIMSQITSFYKEAYELSVIEFTVNRQQL